MWGGRPRPPPLTLVFAWKAPHSLTNPQQLQDSNAKSTQKRRVRASAPHTARFGLTYPLPSP